MTLRHLVFGIVLVGAAALAAFGNSRDRVDIAAPAERPAARAAQLPALPMAPTRIDGTEQARDGANGVAQVKDQQILALAPRDELIGDSDLRFARRARGAAGSDALFGQQNWTPSPPPSRPSPPAPHSAPPLPFIFIGKSVTDGEWEVYLARGDRTYVVHDKDEIDGIYRIQAITPPRMTLTYLPLKQIQQLNIGVFD